VPGLPARFRTAERSAVSGSSCGDFEVLAVLAKTRAGLVCPSKLPTEVHGCPPRGAKPPESRGSLTKAIPAACASFVREAVGEQLRRAPQFALLDEMPTSLGRHAVFMRLSGLPAISDAFGRNGRGPWRGARAPLAHGAGGGRDSPARLGPDGLMLRARSLRGVGA
jgi:hypothetical protein